MAIAGTLEVQMLANMARLTKDMSDAKSVVSGAVSSMNNVLGTLGLSASAAGMGAWIKSTIDAADALNDLSQQISVGIKDLAGWELAAAQNGTTIDKIADGIKKLSKYMGEHGQDLRKLGVDAKNPQEAMLQLADVFAKMPEGATRTALALELFGKSGAELIPTLIQGRDGLEDARSKTIGYADALAYVAPMADEFNDRVAEMTLRVKTMAMGIVGDALPVMILLASEISATGKAGEAAAEDLTPMQAVMETIAVVGVNVAYVIKSVGTEIGGMMAQLAALATLDFAAFSRIGDLMKEDAAAARAEVDRLTKDILNATAKARAEVAKAPDANKSKDIEDAAKSLIATEKATKSAYDELYKSLIKKIAAQEADANATGKLTAAEREYAEFLASVSAGVLKLTPAEMALAAVLWDRYIKLAKLNAEEARYAKQLEESEARAVAAYDAREKDTQGIVDSTKAMRDGTAEIGLTAEALLVLRQARIDDEIATQAELLSIAEFIDKESDAAKQIREHIAALKDRKTAMAENASATKMHDEIMKAADDWRSFDQTAKATFVSIFDSGKNAAQRLRDTFKNMFFDWLYAQAGRPLMFNLAATVSGNAVANQAFSGVSAASSLSSLFGLGGSGAAAGTVAAANVAGMAGGDALGTLIAANSVGWEVGASGVAGGSVLGAAGAALPWIGAGLAVLSLLADSEPDTVRARLAFGQSGYTDNAGMTTRYGTAGFLDAENFSGQAAQAYITALSADLDRLTSSFDNTDEVVQLLTTALAGVEFPSLDTGHTTEEWLSQYATQANQAVLEAAAQALNITTEDVLARVQGADAAKAAKAAAEAAAAEAALTAEREAAQAAAQAAAEAERYAQQVASERQSLEAQLLQMQGDTIELRRRELAALDISNQPLQQRIWALEDEADRLAKIAAIAAEQQGWQDQLDALTGTPQAQIELRNALASATDEGTRAIIRRVFQLREEKTATDEAAASWKQYQADMKSKSDAAVAAANKLVDTAMAAVERAIDAERKRLEVQKSATEKSIDAITSIFEAARDGAAALRGQVDSLNAWTVEQGRAYIDMANSLAMAGGQPDKDRLAKAISAVTGDNLNNYASVADFEYAQLVQAGKLDKLAETMGKQKSVADLQLEAINAQLVSLDDQLAAAQEQVNLLRGIDTGIMSVAEAMGNLATAVLAAKTAGANVVGASGATAADYAAASMQNIVARAAAGQMDPLSAFGDLAGAGYSTAQIAAAWNAKTGESVTATDLQAWAHTNGVPGFASGGYASPGVYIAGENGPEPIYAPVATRIFANGDDGSSEVLDRIVRRLEVLETATRGPVELSQDTVIRVRVMETT